MKNKLLSICIPTYNRAEILDLTLNTLFSNPEFDKDLIEVIVSDNCSTDNTFEIVNKYPLVRYYCNKENVKDRNFSIVLEYATGTYIRLFNDTLSFKPNALANMLKEINNYLNKNVNLFFYENMFLHNNCKIEINSKAQCTSELSYLNTWIGNFGIWKEDFLKIQDKDRFALLQLVQVDWSYHITNNGKSTVVCFEEFFNVLPLSKKGGYNVFNVFINNYLLIIKNHDIPILTYEIEKFRLLRYFIYPWLIILFINENNTYVFDTKGVVSVVFKKYWYEPYLYLLFFMFFCKKIFK